MRSRGSRGDRASQPSTRARAVSTLPAARSVATNPACASFIESVRSSAASNTRGACDVALLQAHPAQLDTHRRGGWIARDMRLQLTSCLRDVALRAKRARFLDRGGL